MPEGYQDWGGNIVILSLYFKGVEGNNALPLFVELKDSGDRIAEVKHEDPNAILNTDWDEWNIDLQDFIADNNQFDLNNVVEVHLVIGDKDEQSEEDTPLGYVHFDDIMLYAPRCLVEPDYDFNNDCVVDFWDLGELADAWLESGLL